jgi:hypothetical protein
MVFEKLFLHRGTFSLHWHFSNAITFQWHIKITLITLSEENLAFLSHWCTPSVVEDGTPKFLEKSVP